jgi:hypothetical protein
MKFDWNGICESLETFVHLEKRILDNELFEPTKLILLKRKK